MILKFNDYCFEDLQNPICILQGCREICNKVYQKIRRLLIYMLSLSEQGGRVSDHSIPKLYHRYFVEKQDERRQLFEVVADRYHPQKGIYPGSFVHITPSLFISEMTYIDSDRRLSAFFEDSKVREFIAENKVYPQDPVIDWYQSDYSEKLPVQKGIFDVMFSFYAGFISQICKGYLKEGGIIVCNNSHGDSSLASVDKDYQLVAVIRRNIDNFTISKENLDTYLIKKDGTPIDREKVIKRMVGENFTKKAFAYIFRYQPKS